MEHTRAAHAIELEAKMPWCISTTEPEAFRLHASRFSFRLSPFDRASSLTHKRQPRHAYASSRCNVCALRRRLIRPRYPLYPSDDLAP